LLVTGVMRPPEPPQRACGVPREYAL